MPISSLDLLRRIIRQENNPVGEPVTNLHGASVIKVATQAPVTTSSWWLAVLPGARAGSLEEFYAGYASVTTRQAQRIDADAGTLVVTGTEVATYLLRATLTVAAHTTVPFDIAGRSTSTDYAVYINGSLIRRGSGDRSMVLSFEPGTHTVDVLVVGSSFGIQAPASVKFTTELEALPAPVWQAVTPSYADPSVGTPAVQLSWTNDTRVGGWSVLRREITPLNEITALSEVDLGGEFGVKIDGNVSDQLPVGGTLFAGYDEMGSIQGVYYDPFGDLTTVRVRLADRRPDTTTAWVGRTAGLGLFRELTRVRRGAQGPVIEWSDVAVQVGVPYEYALQAFSLFDSTLLGPLSAIQYVRAGDVTPPAAIALTSGYPKVVNKRAIVRFTTPADDDYAGIFVYRRQVALTGTANGGTGTTLTTAASVFTAGMVGSFIRITSGTGAGQHREIMSQAGTSVTVPAWSTVPDATSAFEVYSLVKILTDYGVPSASDEVSFEVTTDATYYFVTFDHAGNAQAFSDATSWAYSAASDTYVNANLPPVVELRQLTTTQQGALSAPYNDALNYAVVELAATDPENGTTGVTLEYWRKSDGAWVTGLPATAPAQIDVPAGTRGRYVVVAREDVDNWIRVRAKDAGALYSDTLLYAPDYNSYPEISFLEYRIDPLTDLVTVVGVVDDDTNSLQWWVTPAETGDPTAGSPATIADTSVTKSFTFTFSVLDGRYTDLTIVPYGNTSATGVTGATTSRKVSRPPRTTVTVEDRDSSGRIRADIARVLFDVRPTPPTAVTGTATGGTSTTLSDSTQSWTTDQFAYDGPGLKTYYAVWNNQIRRITANTGTQLTVAPAWTGGSPVSTDPYEVREGATLYSVGTSGGGFTPVLGELYLERGEAGITVEYYSELSGVPREAVHRTTVDPDTVPSIGILSVSEINASELTVEISGLDDDIKRWRAYVRKGTNPTTDGTTTGPLDPQYKRFDGTIAQLSFTLAAGDGTWYVIVVPEGSYNDEGPRVAASAVVDSVGTAVAALSNLSVTTFTHGSGNGDQYHRLSWNHNSYCESPDTTHKVKIYGKRSDQAGDPVELTAGLTRRPWQQVTTPFDTDLTDDVNVTNGTGTFQNQVGTSGTAIERSYTYTVELYVGTTLLTTYTVTKTDTYGLATPADLAWPDFTVDTYGGKQYVTNRYTWTPGEAGGSIQTQVLEYKGASPVYASATIVETVPAELGQARHQRLKDPTGTYWVWVRHSLADGTYGAAIGPIAVDYTGLA